MKIYSDKMPGNLLSSFVVLLTVLSSSSAICEQKIMNKMEHPFFGPIDAYITANETNGAAWAYKKEPTHLYYNDYRTPDPVVYAASHYPLGTGNIYMNVSYDLVPWGQSKTYATIDIWTNCDERSDKMEVYIKNCQVVHGPQHFCLSIGFKNVTCTENGAINNEHYSGVLIADGTGYQHNDFLCDGNAISEQRLNPAHCLAELGLPNYLESLKYSHKFAEAVYTNLTIAIKDDFQLSDLKKREIRIISASIMRQKLGIATLKEELKKDPDDLFIKAKLLEESNKLQTSMDSLAKLKKERLVLSQNFRSRHEIVLEAQEKMKNSVQAIVNLKRYLAQNYCGEEIIAIDHLIAKVTKTIESVEKFGYQNMCTIAYYAVEFSGVWLDSAVTMIPAIGPALFALQENPQCGMFKPGSFIPTTKVTLAGLTDMLVNYICSTNTKLPSAILSWVEINLCQATTSLAWFEEFTGEMLCGDVASEFMEIFVAPALCPLTLGNTTCASVLGSTCDLRDFKNHTIPYNITGKST